MYINLGDNPHRHIFGHYSLCMYINVGNIVYLYVTYPIVLVILLVNYKFIIKYKYI